MLIWEKVPRKKKYGKFGYSTYLHGNFRAVYSQTTKIGKFKHWNCGMEKWWLHGYRPYSEYSSKPPANVRTRQAVNQIKNMYVMAIWSRQKTIGHVHPPFKQIKNRHPLHDMMGIFFTRPLIGWTFSPIRKEIFHASNVPAMRITTMAKNSKKPIPIKVYLVHGTRKNGFH